MAEEGTETLKIRLEDDATDPANDCASALERLAKAQDEQAKAGIGGAAGERQSTAFARLRDMGTKAGSAIASAMAGVQNRMMNAVTATTKLSSALQLAANRAKELKSAEARDLSTAMAQANRIPTALQSSPGEQTGFQKVVAGVQKLFGVGAASKFVEGAGALANASDKLDKSPLAAALKSGAGSVASAAAALAAAGLAVGAVVAAVAVKLAMKVATISIEQTTFREGAQAALDRLTKGNGAATYDATLKIAAELGLDKEDAIAQTKTLLQAQLDKDSIPLALTAIADISTDLGDEKGNALKEKLAQFGHGKKINEDAIRGLAEAGVDATKVFDALKKKGESTNDVLARLKTNQVDSAEAIRAVLAAVESASGGAAAGKARSIPGLVNAISIAFDGLFDKVDTSPVKGALANVYSILSGPDGDRLKTAMTNLGGQLFQTLFSQFEGTEGQERLKRFTNAIIDAAERATRTLKELEPEIKVITDAILKLTEAYTFVNGGKGTRAGGLAETRSTEQIAKDNSTGSSAVDLGIDVAKWSTYITNPLGSALGAVGEAVGAKIAGAIVGAPTASADAGTGGQGAGGNMADGYAAGVRAGTPGAVTASRDMVRESLAAVAAEQDSHSPSKAFGKLGGFAAQGYAIQLKNGGDQASEAGAGLAASALGGTKQQAANDVGSLAPAGAGQGGGVTFNITVTGGTPEQNKKAGDEIGEAAYSTWSKHFGRKMRDIKREAG